MAQGLLLGTAPGSCQKAPGDKLITSGELVSIAHLEA